MRREHSVEGPQIARKVRRIADSEVCPPPIEVGWNTRLRQLAQLTLHHHLKGKFPAIFQLASSLNKRMREVDSDRAGTKPAQLETRAANGTPDIKRSGGSRHSPTVDEFMNASHREVQSFAWSRMFSQNLLFRTVVKEEIFSEQPGR